MSVAETILQQLGGQRFTAMTGSKNYLADGNSLNDTCKEPQQGKPPDSYP